MIFSPRYCIIGILMVPMTACTDVEQQQAPVCSEDWYTLAETRIATSDGQGHGPDPGSIEWRSTIEFKLGIRDDPAVPALDAPQWCGYINAHFIAPGP